MLSNMKRKIWPVLLGLGLLSLTSAGALAETGSGDSPLFSLNTQSAAGIDESVDLPQRDHLGGCYPNPFNPLTSIGFGLAKKTEVGLRVYDLQGRLVRVLLDRELFAAGLHQAVWNGRDGQGKSVAAGVYVYRLVTDNFVGAQRMTLVK